MPLSYTKHILIALVPGIILGLLGFYGIKSTGILDGEKPQPLSAYVILSGSMEPELPVGGVVISQKADTYQVGDIITFKQANNQFVTHRIEEITAVDGETAFVTKGDQNENVDQGWVLASQVEGKVMQAIPYIGHGVEFAKTPKGFVAIVVIPATIVVYEELKTILKEMKLVGTKLFKRRKVEKDSGHAPYWRAALVVPVIGAGLLAAAFSGAYFSDLEYSLSNILGIATSYGEEEPEPEPELHLVINEYLPRPSITFTTEWVELYNPTSEDINLAGWSLLDAAHNEKTLSGIVPAGGFFIYETNSWLNNTGDTVILQMLNPASEIVDQHSYTNAQPDVSIGRIIDGFGAFHECDATSKGLSNNSLCGSIGG